MCGETGPHNIMFLLTDRRALYLLDIELVNGCFGIRMAESSGSDRDHLAFKA